MSLFATRKKYVTIRIEFELYTMFLVAPHVHNTGITTTYLSLLAARQKFVTIRIEFESFVAV